MTEIQDILSKMRTVREAITPGPWRLRKPNWAFASDQRVRKQTFRVEAPYKGYGWRDLGLSAPATFNPQDAIFIAQAPQSQKVLEEALLIAVNFLSKMDLSHYEDCKTLQNDELKCDCGRLKELDSVLSSIKETLKKEIK